MGESMEVDSTTPPVAPEVQVDPPAKVMRAELKSAVSLLERYVSSREMRFATAALRLLSSLRKKAKSSPAEASGVITATISSLFGASHPLRAPILSLLNAAVPPAAVDADEELDKKRVATLLPEVELFVCLLALLVLIDAKAHEQSLPCSLVLIERLGSWNRRTLDLIAERVYFFTSWAHERAGKLSSLRATLLGAQRTASLHHNNACQATLLNLLLRSYQHDKLYDQADKLLAKSTFPESASNCQLARFLYYQGRIKAIQLEYSDAHSCLLQAQRKAPSGGTTALGFKLAAHKLGAIVQLLLGEIPERAIFRGRESRAQMRPYLLLVQAVRLGDLAAFKAAMAEHEPTFKADGNFTLVLRLRQNVIRAGLRNVSLAYTKISLADAAAKLRLDNPADMEPIAAKAIRDGVIDATIDHANGVLLSKESHDVYSTLEPQAAFHKRVLFCLNLHNDAVKAMSYPPDAHKNELPDADTIKERQREEQELAQSLAEEDDGDELF